MLFFSVPVSEQGKRHLKNLLHTKQLVELRRNSIRFRLDLTCQTVLRTRRMEEIESMQQASSHNAAIFQKKRVHYKTRQRLH